MGRRKRSAKNHSKQEVHQMYSETVKENHLFLKFYGGLGIMPQHEVADFYNTMKEPLPVAFRITGIRREANELSRLLKDTFFKDMATLSLSVADQDSARIDGIEVSGTGSRKPLMTAHMVAVDSTDTHFPGNATDVNYGAGCGGGGQQRHSCASAADDVVMDSTELLSQTTQNAVVVSACRSNLASVESDNERGQLPPSQTHSTSFRAVKPPRCLSWYPGQLAWQLDLSRKAVRSLDVLSNFHSFLVSETESGNVSRQEAVSMIPPLLLDVRPDSKVLDLCAAPGSKTAQLLEFLHAGQKDALTDEASSGQDGWVPSGVVVANDKNSKRCYLMVHQVKRLASPCVVIVNHDATVFPRLRMSRDGDNPDFLRFDRVLVDVPCSGDGTLRKNIDIWTKWRPTTALSLHSLQLKILRRGLELLDIGGRLVYSTCSLHPVEDEAVLSETLRHCQGSVEIVDVSDRLVGLKTTPGLLSWQLMSRDGVWLTDYDSLPHNLRSAFHRSMFPPSREDAKKYKLNLCHRILPHHQDTGGFFVVLLHKIQPLPWSSESQKNGNHFKQAHCPEVGSCGAIHQSYVQSHNMSETLPTPDFSTVQPLDTDEKDCLGGDDDNELDGALSTNASCVDEATPWTGVMGTESASDLSDLVATTNINKRKSQHGYYSYSKRPVLGGFKEDPFIFLSHTDPMLTPIREFYGLSETFPVDQLLARSQQGNWRALYFVNKAVKQIAQCNDGAVKFVNMGVKFVSRSPSPIVPDCDFRLSSESIGYLVGHLSKRMVPITQKDAILILTEENPLITELSQPTQCHLLSIGAGSIIFSYRPKDSVEYGLQCSVDLCGWRGKVSVRSFVDRHQRLHYRRLFGLEHRCDDS